LPAVNSVTVNVPLLSAITLVLAVLISEDESGSRVALSSTTPVMVTCE